MKVQSRAFLALAFLPALTSAAQEALRSALYSDAAINSQTNAVVTLQPGTPRLGPLDLDLGAYFGVTFDDNINAAQDHAVSDTSFHEGVNVGFLWPATANSHLQLASQFGYVTYLDHTRSDSIEIAPNSALTWAFTFEDGSLTFYDTFDYSDEVITVPSVADLNSLPRIENTIGTRAQWSPGKWQWEAGISHDDFQSPKRSLDYLNRGSEYLFLRGAWQFAENTQAGMEFSASQTDYQLKTQSDNTSFSLGPFAKWTVTRFLNASISGGPTIYHFAATGPSQPANTLTSYYFDLDVDHQLTEFVSQHLSAHRDVSLGYNQGNDYTEQLSLCYAINWTATRYANLGLTVTYERGTQPLRVFVFTVNESFERVGISPNFSYQITDKLTGSMNFSHWDRSSNLSGHNYSENSVSLQFHYQF